MSTQDHYAVPRLQSALWRARAEGRCIACGKPVVPPDDAVAAGADRLHASCALYPRR